VFTALAQYLAAVFIFNNPKDYLQTLSVLQLHLMILATVCIVAGGFIINSFYDLEKDLVNRPHRTLFSRVVSKQTCLRMYFSLSIIGLGICLICSFKVFIYFAFFTFLLWFYSHKLQKIPVIKELTASLLSVMSVLSIALYYAQFNWMIAAMGIYIGFLLLSRELIKDLRSIEGDKSVGNDTVAVLIGSNKTKVFFAITTCLAIISVFVLNAISPSDSVLKQGYTLVQVGVLLAVLILVLKAQKAHHFRLPHTVFKILLAGAIVFLVLL
jgi:4-hydroxybenzoate polyprenyltransferase